MAAESKQQKAKSGKRTRRGREVQRRRILDAASELFAQQGYHGTGIEELSQAVGLGRGALYHHIGNKESVLFEICSVNVIEMIAVGSEIVAREDEPVETRMRTLLDELINHIARNSQGWTVFFRDYIALTGQRLKKVLRLRTEFEQLVADLMEEGMASGELRRVDPIFVKGILGQFNYSYLWIREDGRLTPSQVAEIFCDALFDGLRNPDAAGR